MSNQIDANLPVVEGRIAYHNRKDTDTNPYVESDWRHNEWWLGWSMAEESDVDEAYDWKTASFKSKPE